MKKLFVNVNNGYEILIEKGLLSNCGEYVKSITAAKKVCVISDTNVFSLYSATVVSQLEAQGFKVITYVFPAGEESKKASCIW